MTSHVQTHGRLTQLHDRVGELFVQELVVCLQSIPVSTLTDCARMLRNVRRHHRRIYVFGNGGSASTASHMVCDLVKTARRAADPALRVFALTDNVATVTAYANDCSYDEVFARQLADNAEAGDVVVAVSASGRSSNILAGLQTARRMGLHSIGLFGSGGGPAADLVDIPVIVESVKFGVIETAHVAIIHAWVDYLAEIDRE